MEIGGNIMYKFFKIGIPIVLVLFATVGVYKTVTTTTKLDTKEVLQNATILGDTIVSLYRSDLDTATKDYLENSEAYNSGVVQKLLDFSEDLKATNNTKFDLSAYYAENYTAYYEQDTEFEEYASSSDDPLFVILEDEGYVSDYVEDITLEAIPDSDFVYYDGDTAYIDFNKVSYENNSLFVTYKETNFDIPIEDLPETYSYLKGSSRYIFSQSEYYIDEKDSAYMDMKYVSINDSSLSKTIRVYLEKGEIIDFEVNGYYEN